MERAFDIVGVGASAGGLEAVSNLLAALARPFPAAIVVAQHRAQPGMFVELVARHSRLLVQEAVAGDRVLPGHVYVAPAGFDCRVGRDRRIKLETRPPETARLACPSVDVLFTSIADAYRDRALGVVLSGRLRDGAIGARAIKQRGGRILVQDEGSAKFFDMPSATLATGCADFQLPVAGIAAALSALVLVPGVAPLFHVNASPWARFVG